jgi:hypothetical protein
MPTSLFQNFNLFVLILIISTLSSCNKDVNNEFADLNSEISTASWMSDLIQRFPNKDITLKDIVLPGAHDAGLYQLPTCTLGANACNTKTQKLNFEQQLMAGVRIFDIRPSYGFQKYYTEHSTGCGGLGCKGGLMKDLYSALNNFLETHRELVILELSHFCKTGIEDTAFMNLTFNTLDDKVYKETSESTIPFVQQPINNILGTNNKGKVILIFEGIENTLDNKRKGMFSGALIPREGRWSNSPYLEDMLKNQLIEFENYSNNSQNLFAFSWQITQNPAQAISCALSPNAISIEKSADSANAKIYPIFDSLILNNKIKKGRIPNILYHDFSEKRVSEECIKISLLNLE